MPLGLGDPLPKTPIITISIVACLVAIFLYWGPCPSFTQERDEIEEKHSMKDRKLQLFLSYCQKHEADALICDQSGEALMQLFDNKDLDEILPENEQQQNQASKELIRSFYRKFSVEDKEIKELDTYPQYLVAKEAMSIDLQNLYKTNDMLSSQNHTILAVLKASVLHSGLIHLISNIIGLICFGIYVELRMKRLLFFLCYLLGGMFGLYLYASRFMEGDRVIIGASANVSAVMGMFFVFYYRFRMKMLIIMGIIKTFSVKVLYWFPFMYLLTEVVYAYGSYTNHGTGIAHLAHIGGMSFGVIAAIVIKAFHWAPWPFRYPYEYSLYMKTKEIVEFVEKDALYEEILKYNPENVQIRWILIKDFLDRLTSVTHKENILTKIKTNLVTLTEELFRNNKLQELVEHLNYIPIEMSFVEYLPDIEQMTIIKIGDYALDHNEYVVALRFYAYYVQKYPHSINTPSIFNTLKSLINGMTQKEEFNDPLERFASSHIHPAVRKILGQAKMGRLVV